MADATLGSRAHHDADPERVDPREDASTVHRHTVRRGESQWAMSSPGRGRHRQRQWIPFVALLAGAAASVVAVVLRTMGL